MLSYSELLRVELRALEGREELSTPSYFPSPQIAILKIKHLKDVLILSLPAEHSREILKVFISVTIQLHCFVQQKCCHLRPNRENLIRLDFL